MTRFSIQLLMLVIATALAGATLATPARAGTSHRKHIKMHSVHVHRGIGDARAADWNRTAVRQPAVAGVCPGGIHRSFECSVWPPPIEDDPDRVIGGAAAD